MSKVSFIENAQWICVQTAVNISNEPIASAFYPIGWGSKFLRTLSSELWRMKTEIIWLKQFIVPDRLVLHVPNCAMDVWIH
jgi:hypothetical protein